jgi:hypothetical protein
MKDQNKMENKKLLSVSGRPVPTEEESLQNFKDFSNEIDQKLWNHNEESENLNKVVEDVLCSNPNQIPDHILNHPGFHKAMKKLSEESSLLNEPFFDQFVEKENQDLGPGNYEKMMGGDNLQDKYVDAIDQLIKQVENSKQKPKVATGRKAGKDKKTAMESLKFQRWVKKLKEKRDDVNVVEQIIDQPKNTNHAMYSNTATVFLNPTGKHFYEEALLQEKFRKIQGFKK